MPEQMLMKDGLGDAAVKRIANALSKTYPPFKPKRFLREARAGLEPLELKERVLFLIDLLHRHLPADFNQTAEILMALKADWDRGAENDPLRGFAAWPLIDYVGVHGLAHPKIALKVLETLTPLFTAEQAIRPFIVEHFDLTFKHLKKWCSHSDHHVRRLVSEGTRPRIPWGFRLHRFCDDPSPILPLLEALKSDESEYVRRSVANNLNDISKDHPDIVISTCRRWQKGASEEEAWVVRHATRTLVKAGHPSVFGLLGYTENPKVSIASFRLEPPRIKLGERLHFELELKSESNKSQTMVVDYAIHHMKANGQLAPKVFKLKNLTLAPGESFTLTRAHPIKKITTRTYYPGRHAVELFINGSSKAKTEFTLQV